MNNICTVTLTAQLFALFHFQYQFQCISFLGGVKGAQCNKYSGVLPFQANYCEFVIYERLLLDYSGIWLFEDVIVLYIVVEFFC